MNLLTRQVARGEQAIELTAREFSLLEHLMRSPGRVLTRVEICERVWDYNFDPGTNLVDVYIQRLRKKVDGDSPQKLIETIRGVGYRIRARRMKPLPSRLKIALLSAGISGLVLVAFGVVMWMLIYDLRIEAVDREIRTLGSRHPGLFAGRGNYDRLASSLEFTFGEDFTNRVILLMRDSAGRAFYRSPHWPKALDPEKLNLSLDDNPRTSSPVSMETNSPGSLAGTERSGPGRGGMGRGFGMGRGGPPPEVVFTKPAKFLTARTHDAVWRFGVLGNDAVTLVIGLNQQEVERELNQLRVAFLLTLPVALFLVGLGGWVVAGRALRPLKTIAETAERLTARGLDQRIPESGDSPEASRVIQVLNRMIDRLEASFRQAIRFSADASHELKTPLTVMQGELENALQSAASGSPEQQLFSNLLEETQRLKTITRSLLLLAQADAGQLKLVLEPVDLSAALEGMVEDARVLAADSRLNFDLQREPKVCVEADRALLQMALFNLVVNAIKFNEPEGRVTLKLVTADDRAIFTICNTGPGIPVADQPKIFERFYRVDRAQAGSVDGIGLGLSLAREIVRAHGGDLKLMESRTGLTCFELWINVIRKINALSEPGRNAPARRSRCLRRKATCRSCRGIRATPHPPRSRGPHSIAAGTAGRLRRRKETR